MSEDQGSTGDVGLLTPVKLLFAAAVFLAVVAGFGWLVVVSFFGLPWEVGFPLSLLFGFAMLAWTGGATRWKLLSVALWVAGFVWLVAYWLG